MSTFKKLQENSYDMTIYLDYILPLYNGEISVQEIPYINPSIIDRIARLGKMTAERADMIESLKVEMESM